MTREIKLSILLGFGLLLGIGVLISDHLSPAHQTPEALVDFGGLDAPPDEPAPIVRPVPRSRGNTLAQTEIPPGDPQNIARTLTNWFLEGDRPPGAYKLDERDGGTDAAAEHRETDPTDLRDDPILYQPPLTPENSEIEMGIPLGPQGDTPLRELTRHRIVEGESLWSIAAYYYGDGHVHTQLAAFNRGRIGPGGTIRVGATLLIPPWEDLFAERSTSPRRDRSRDRSPRPAPRVYRVEPGDTLSEIAKDQLGNASRWDEILRLNRDQLDSPEQLVIGMELVLPSR